MPVLANSLMHEGIGENWHHGAVSYKARDGSFVGENAIQDLTINVHVETAVPARNATRVGTL